VTCFIEEHRHCGVELTCEVLGVGVSTHYERLKREPSAREQRDALLAVEIQEARAGFRRVYGARKTWKQLKRNGVDDVGRDRVARVMRSHGWEGVSRGKKPRTTVPGDEPAERPSDLLDRDFTATRPNEKWVADFTYVRTWQGFVYMAFILDVYSRYIVGWQIATHMRTDLVMDALEMAHGLRQPPKGVIAHNDRGSQYTSVTYTERLIELGLRPSIGSRGDAYDNAMAESFVGTYKAEFVAGRRFPSFELAEHETAQWIGFYNLDRLHEELDDVPPAEFEILHTVSQEAALLA
jgi:transposase InsO family protein